MNTYNFYKITTKIDIKPCPPNLFFPAINYAIKVIPHDENFPK